MDLRDLFPKDFVFRDEHFNKEGAAIVEVGVITPEWQQRVKDEIQQKSRLKGHVAFLSQDYLQYLGARMPGSRDKSNKDKTSHADWDRALLAIYGDARPDAGAEINVEFDDPVPLNKNATNISNTLMREYATNINNIWDGSIHQKLRLYVIRYLLRINLRPISENNYRENKRQRAIDKAEQRKLESDSANERERGAFRVWRRRHTELCDQLDRAVSTERPNERINKVLRLIGIHLSRHPSKKEALTRSSRRDSGGMEYEYESDSEFDESDSEDSDCDSELGGDASRINFEAGDHSADFKGGVQENPTGGSSVENSAFRPGKEACFITAVLKMQRLIRLTLKPYCFYRFFRDIPDQRTNIAEAQRP